MRILILGGYGTFGSRVARLLAGKPDIELLIAGRNLARAQAFCAGLDGNATPLRGERNTIAPILAAHRPDLLIDASGPFQAYGAQPYGVAQAAIAAGIPYLDLADGAEFVSGISALDADARQAGVFALSGASTFPALSSAVLAEMQKTMEVEEIFAAIAPSPHAGIGLNVVRAVLSYAGRGVPLWRDGTRSIGRGLAESRITTIAPPGALPLAPRRVGLVDVPDLCLLPAQQPGLRTVWVGAGMRPGWLMWLLVLAARLRLPLLHHLARPAHWLLNHLGGGEARGGMVITARGRVDGQPMAHSWHMIAPGDSGPFVPAMAVVAIIARMRAGQPPAPGARPALGAVTLQAYTAQFAPLGIISGWRIAAGPAPLYRQILGPAYDTMPAPLQALHNLTAPRQWRGRAKVQRGRGLLARLLARAYGFPRTGQDIPVSVHFTPDTKGELWERRFGPSRFRSHQRAGTGRNAHLILERFGAITVAMAAVIQDGQLHLVLRRWWCLGLPLPRALLPDGESFEHATDGRFNFDVTIKAPLIGLIVRYQGWLEPA